MARVPPTDEDCEIITKRLMRLVMDVKGKPWCSIIQILQRALNDYVEPSWRLKFVTPDMTRGLTGLNPVAAFVDDYAIRGMPVDLRMVVKVYEPPIPLLKELTFIQDRDVRPKMYATAKERRGALRGSNKPKFSRRQK